MSLKRISASWLPEIGILWVFLASRLWNTLTLPSYMDEGSMLTRARFMERGQFVFDPLVRIGKWLQPAAMSLFSPDGPESLWLSRAVTALLAMLSVAACISLGRMLASRNVGRLAGAFYIFPSLAFFVERHAVSDDWMAGFSALALALTVRMILTRQARYVLPLGLTMAAAFLSKISAATLLPVPFIAAWVLARRAEDRGTNLLRSGLSVALSVAVVGTLYAVALRQNPQPAATSWQGIPLGSICDWSKICEGIAPVLADLGHNLGNIIAYGMWAWMLVGPPMLALTISSLAFLRGTRGRGIVFLWLTMLIRAVPLVVVASWLHIRNFLVQIVPLTVLAAMSISEFRQLSHRHVKRPLLRKRIAIMIAGAALIAPLWSLPRNVTFATRPQEVFVPPRDPYNCELRHRSYRYGYGYLEVSQTLQDWIANDHRRANVIAEDGRHMLSYWGPRMGNVEGWDGSDSLRVKVAQWLIADELIFFVDEVPTRPIPTPMPDEPFGAILETVAVHPIPCGDVSMRVRRLVADSPELRRSIYEIVFPSPNDVAEQYRAIALHLIDTQAEGAVVVYPPNQFELLDNRLQWGTELDGVYALGDMWPLNAQLVEEELEDLSAEHRELHVVLLAEENGDPEHVIETWLNTNMQLEEELWFGPVRVLNYIPQ